MAVKKITRKVISKAASAEKAAIPLKQTRPVEEKAEETVRTGGASGTRGADGAKKACFFCQSKTSPSYTDMNVLRRFATDRAKIIPKLRSGLCSRHQRAVTRQVKYARHLALLPFTPKM